MCTRAVHVISAVAGTSPALTMAKVDPNADFSSDYEDLAFGRSGDCD